MRCWKLIYYYFEVLICVFICFCTSACFSSSGRGSILVLSAPGHAGSPPEHHDASVGPGQGQCHVLWGFKVARNHGEAFRARRAIHAHANPRTYYRLKQCPTVHHVISRILNVVNVVKHYLVMMDMRPLLVQEDTYCLRVIEDNLCSVST